MKGLGVEVLVAGLVVSTSPQSGIKSSLKLALVCTTRRRIPVSASTNQGPEKGNLVSYLRRIDFVYHSTLGLRVIKKKKSLRAGGWKRT